MNFDVPTSILLYNALVRGLVELVVTEMDILFNADAVDLGGEISVAAFLTLLMSIEQATRFQHVCIWSVRIIPILPQVH